jgi:hypothetical protein
MTSQPVIFTEREIAVTDVLALARRLGHTMVSWHNLGAGDCWGSECMSCHRYVHEHTCGGREPEVYGTALTSPCVR